MLIKSLSPVINFENLKEEVFHVINTVQFRTNQIMCQTLENGSEDFLTGVGRIDELEHQDEHLYKFTQPILHGTILEKLMIEYGAYRTRILKLPPRSCYSIHKDPTPRIHIPIVTSGQSWMIWPYHATCLHLKVGNVYWTDTTEPHTFINGDSDIERIHIVMAVK